MYWLRFWSQLKKNDQNKEMIHRACLKLEMVAMQLFIDHGCRFCNMICS
jgi:hypothetical protein